MKKIILLVLVGQYIYCQNTTKVEKMEAYERVYIEVGAFNAIDNLKQKISLSPNVGFWFKTKLRTDESVDFGFNLNLPKTNEAFSYQKSDSIFVSKIAGISGMVGLRYNLNYKFSKTKNISLDWFPSFGYAFARHKPILLATDNMAKTELNQEFFSTIHLGQGIRFNIDNIGIQVQYQYTPYHFFYKHLDKNFGSQSLIFGIVYRQ